MDRPEVSTPQSSWIRMKEGMALYENNIPIYDGDSFHDTPLMLQFFLHLKSISPFLVPVVFVLADVVAAIHLSSFAKFYMGGMVLDQQESRPTFADDSYKILINRNRKEWVPNLVCLLYMLNPFLIAACVARTTIVFQNLFLCLLFYHTVKGNIIQSSFFLALTTYQSFYPFQLLAPVVMYFHKNTNHSIQRCFVAIISLFVVWNAILFGASGFESFDSTTAPFKFILTVPDLTPNVGIFWYFFTEVFNHFHTFFLAVFQLNVIIFSLPLTIKLRSRPIFLMFLLCYIIATFKSYPSVADAGLCLCFLPVWSHTFEHLRSPLITSVMLLVSSILCPIMWHLWIQAGTANANFYFATTLTYTTSHVLILTDLLIAYLKYDYHLFEGLNPKLDGTEKEAVIRLKN